MMIANYVAAECGQHFARRLPQNLFAKFARARFSPHHCASILGDYVREDSEVGRFLSPDSVARGDAAGTDELLYPAPTPWLFGFVRSYTERAIHRRTPIKLLRLPAAATRPAADALRSMLTEDAT